MFGPIVLYPIKYREICTYNIIVISKQKYSCTIITQQRNIVVECNEYHKGMQIDLFQILTKYVPQTRAGKTDDSNFPASERSLSITKMQ